VAAMSHHAIKTAPQHATWPQLLALWQAADEIDVFESAWNWDHFYPLAPPYDGPNFEGWTMLAALAQATSRIRLGSMVNGMHHRHPAITANMAATLDHISSGRFELGMGAGWNFMESDAYGLELGELRDRSDRLEEGIEVIIQLLSQQHTTHKGRFFELTEALCEPKPIQNRIPIVIGGTGRRRTLRTAAKYADHWDATLLEQPSDFTELDGVLREHCEQVGRDQSEIRRSIHFYLDAETDPRQAVDRAHGFFDVGVDIAIWGFQIAPDVGRLVDLAEAIRDR
jgi:F420-dependent oxidoreductase-like protein